MKLHQLGPKLKRKKKRVGRGIGSGKGTYSGRGIKGEKARSGFKIPLPPQLLKLPKLRGERMRKIKKEKERIVNLEDLEKGYKMGEEVSLKSLIEKGIVDKKTKKVKILGRGKLTKKLKFAEDILFSKRASDKIKIKKKEEK